MERDDEGCAFMGMDFLNRKLGVDHPANEIYEQVFDGEIDGKSPEDVFAKFNWDHPEGYRGRSLSVSDVVEIIDSAEVEPGFYFCDSIGFKKVESTPAVSPSRRTSSLLFFWNPASWPEWRKSTQLWPVCREL